MDINIVTRVDVSMSIEDLLLIQDSLHERYNATGVASHEVKKLQALYNEIYSITHDLKC